MTTTTETETKKIATIVIWIWIAGLALIAGGCSSESGNDVYGTVTYKGRELPQGSICFIGEGNKKTRPIFDGTYDCRLEPGVYKITIVSELPEEDREPGDTASSMQIPLKYATPESSGLVRKVEDDPHRLDINLN